MHSSNWVKIIKLRKQFHYANIVKRRKYSTKEKQKNNKHKILTIAFYKNKTPTQTVKMDQKPRSRANSVIGQIKWWTSSNNHFTNNNTTTNNHNIKHFGSSVAVQKLRESKWFGPDESRIFCAVIECGFIVETREGQENDGWFGVVYCKTSKGKHYKTKSFKNGCHAS